MVDTELTVEQYLTMQCDAVIGDLRAHGDDIIARLRREYEHGAGAVEKLLADSISARPLVVTLKCIGGPHLGQKFRLEPSAAGDDVFKVGRSTGRHFKEKGVSIYKDKEISTTHAKVYIYSHAELGC